MLPQELPVPELELTPLVEPELLALVRVLAIQVPLVQVSAPLALELRTREHWRF